MRYYLQELFIRLKREPRTRPMFSVHAPPGQPRPLPKTIWVLWLQGEDEAPEIVKYCLESWRRLNPSYEVRVLDDASVSQYIDTAHIPDELEVSARANLIRTRLLAEHGGIWADATLLCTRPLDHWLPPLMQAGYFCFDRPDKNRPMDNWFLASEADGEIAKMLDEIMCTYWSHRAARGRRNRPTYFWFHFLVDFHGRFNRRFRKLWAGIPKVSADGPHCLQTNFTGNQPWRDADTIGDLDSILRAPMQKLSYKVDLTPEIVEQTFAEARAMTR